MIELQVEGMSCGHCASTVQKAVRAVDAAARVDVDLGKRKVRVESTATPDDIASAISEAGYPVVGSAQL
jgi:copper chaperone